MNFLSKVKELDSSMLYDSLETNICEDGVFVDFNYELLGQPIGFGNISLEKGDKTLGWHTFYPISFAEELKRDETNKKLHPHPIGTMALYQTLDSLVKRQQVQTNYKFNNVIDGNFSDDFIALHEEIGLDLTGETVGSSINKLKNYLVDKGYSVN